MAVRSLYGVLLLVPTLWALGATQKISVGFLKHTFSGKEGEEAVASVKVEVPKGFEFGDTNEGLTIVVTSADGEAKAGRDFELVDGTITLTTEDLKRIQKSKLGHTNIAVEISLNEDDYIEPSQTFTLTLEVQSALEYEKHVSFATFTITDKESDTVKISFDQPTYTAYASQNTGLKLLKTGHIRQDISVDVTFSNGSRIQIIVFGALQNEIEVSFDPGSEAATYSLSLALADPSHDLEGLVVLGAPAEVTVMEFTPEGSRIIKLLEREINASVVILQEKCKHLEGMYKQQYQYLRDNYTNLQRKYYDLQEKYDYLQRKLTDAETGYDKELQGDYPDYYSSPSKAPTYTDRVEVDSVKVWFDQDYYTVRENDEVRVCLDVNTDYMYEDIIVTVTAKENFYLISAIGGRDFSTAPHKITIPAYSTYTSYGKYACEYIDVIIDDNDKEGRESFNLTLTVDGHPGVTSSATVIIIDNDIDRKVVWAIVAVVTTIVIIAVAIAACVIYRQRTKIKECFCSPYKKLPTDVHIETVTF